MNNARTEIDNWFIEGTLAGNESAIREVWEPVFDADRHLVHTKIGPYWKLFLRPEGFVKRFYHKVYPLPIESWRVTEQVKLYDGFCTFDVAMDIRFQATLKYARSNMDVLSDINKHIKTAYQDLLSNLIQKELLNLSDASWVQKGVTEIAKRISFAVSEMLIMQNIQSQTLCTLKPSFAEFPNVQLAQESVFLCVLKRSFEFGQAKRETLFRQEQEIERQNQEHKQKLLADKEEQLLGQFEIEKRLHLETLKHENNLKEITLEADIQEQQKRENRLRMDAQEKQRVLLAHQTQLKEKELAVEIAQYENQQAKWQEAKDKIHAQQMVIEQRQKQREFDAGIKNQKYREQQHLEMQKENYEKAKDFDVYLHREIELLQLEKQSLDLQLQIKEAKKQRDGNNNAPNLKQ